MILRGQDGHQHPRDLPHQWTGRCSKQQTLQMLDRYFNINDLRSDVSFYLRSSKRIRPEKFKPEQDLSPSLCGASAVPHQLNYQANWELVTMWVYDKPADSGYTVCVLISEVSFELWMEMISMLMIFVVMLSYLSSRERKA